jgi:hypothetical protein
VRRVGNDRRRGKFVLFVVRKGSVLCFSDFSVFLCDNALAVRAPARVKKGRKERRARRADELYPCVARCRFSLLSAFLISVF